MLKSNIYLIRGTKSMQSKYFRISLTDKCNLSCFFCHNEGQAKPFGKGNFLKAEDYVYVSQIAKDLGYSKFKLTGGEPTLHPEVLEIVSGIASLNVSDLSMISNGIRLDKLAFKLREAGLNRLNVSLYTLNPAKFKFENGGNLNSLKMVVNGIDKAIEAGYDSIKLNYIWTKENMSDFVSITEFASSRNLTVVLLPMMKFGTTAEYDEISLIELYQMLQSLGISHEKIITDNEGISKKLVVLKSNAKVLIRVEELKDKMPYNACATCNKRTECREGIFPTRFSSMGTLYPCLADGIKGINITQDILRKNEREIINAFNKIHNYTV